MNHDLIIFPCSQWKRGWGQAPLPEKTVFDFLGQEASDMLTEARALAFKAKDVSKDCSAPRVPALILYSGITYNIPGFKDLVWEALKKGVHCLIVSGGYGVVRPEEPIHPYEAYMPKTSRVWGRYLPDILGRYMTENNIKRVFVACSTPYAKVLLGPSAANWTQQAIEVYCYVPMTSARVTALRKIGEAIIDLITSSMVPDGRWRKSVSV